MHSSERHRHHASSVKRPGRTRASLSALIMLGGLALGTTSSSHADTGCWPADINCDGMIDGADLGRLLALWGTDNATGDLDGNGTVDGGDLGLMLAQWGPVQPSPEVDLMASPKEFLVGDDLQVRFQVLVPPSSGDAVLDVQVLSTDQSGNTHDLAKALDNGNLLNGDDIAGDGVFSAMVSYQPTQPFQQDVTAKVFYASGMTVDSKAELIQAVQRLTPEEAHVIAEASAQAESLWKAYSDQFGETDEARARAAEAIAGLAGVEDAGITETGQNIWITFIHGIGGGVLTGPEGTRSGQSRKAPPRLATKRESRRPQVAPELATDPSEFVVASASSGGVASNQANDYVGSQNVLIWDAYNWEFAPFDEGPYLRDLYSNNECPSFNVDYLVNAETTVESVESFTNYDTIVMVTHGVVNGDGNVIFMTFDAANANSILEHNADLMLGRLGIINNSFTIRPSKITSLAGGFDDAIIYNGSCESSKNNTMQDAFFQMGATAYYGFTEVVGSPFAESSATQLFDGLLLNELANGPAFNAVQPKVEPIAVTPAGPAVFTQGGQQNLLYGSEPQNLDFENGLNAWSTEGDGRWLFQLGGWMPINGNRMGIISTGLGFSVDSGSIEQTLCLPANTTKINFNWSFFSEEFIEWCGPEWQFDDAFVVELEWAGGTVELFRRDIDGLCNQVFPTPLFFDQSQPDCNPQGDGWGSGANDCNVWTTDWTNTSINIEALAHQIGGGTATLRFRAHDVGDSLYDSAILLDDIQIVASD
ncbi:MAG: hypothetical protein MK085_09325, partial [Phycisphaerales bacterium]|nr:hypothetical protein [Phycisphaerales bacterium]